MRHRIVLLLLCLPIFSLSCAQRKPVGEGATLVFTHVIIIDTTGGPMFGFPIHLDWRERAARGELLAPRQAIASTIVDGPGATWVGSIKVANETDARRAVQEIKSSGFDFVKIYAGLPRDAYFAIADESAKQGLIFAGHVPHSVSALEASEVGQKSIEHLSGVLEGCSPIGGEITRGYNENMRGLLA